MASSSSDALLEQLLARVEKLEVDLAAKDATIKAQADRITALETENAKLKRRLGLDSTNSSKPPSCDHPAAKPTPRSLRTPTGRKPGKQPGNPGHTLAQVADPHHVIDHYPATCGGCDSPLQAARPAGMRRCQVFDLPELVGLKVTEHRYHRLRCACGHATAPAPAPSPARARPPATGPASARPAPT